MAYAGTDNLRCYLHSSPLPEMLNDIFAPSMPPKGHKSHQNHLSVRSEAWRRLESVHSFTESEIEEMVASWVDTYIPEESLGIADANERTGERLTVPGPPMFNIAAHLERRPDNIIRLSAWLDNLPLMTVQRVLHILFPETRGYRFSSSDEDDRDRKSFRYFLWTQQIQNPADSESTPDVKIGRKSVVIAYQPPWILSEQDMKEFSTCRSFPPFRVRGNAFPSPLESKERVWAKIWDICVSRNTSWFVVTSYNQWVFGAFSTGWTTAFVSNVYDFDTYGPTILEWLTFWVASAMGLHGSAIVPQVPEPVHSLGPLSIPRSHDTNSFIPEAANSESHWDGKSEEAASSAGVDDTISVAVSDTGLSVLSAPVNRSTLSLQKVATWMQGDALPSSSRSARSLASNTAINTPGLDNNDYQGDWLA